MQLLELRASAITTFPRNFAATIHSIVSALRPTSTPCSACIVAPSLHHFFPTLQQHKLTTRLAPPHHDHDHFSSLQVVKTFELQSKSKTDLTKQLEELKTELLNLRVQKVAGDSSSKILRINSLRKDIARVLTVMNQKQRANLREFYKGKSQIPLDLRAKKTRAIRRKLNQVSVLNRSRHSLVLQPESGECKDGYRMTFADSIAGKAQGTVGFHRRRLLTT